VKSGKLKKYRDFSKIGELMRSVFNLNTPLLLLPIEDL
jgi:hypothetical protein